ncbi:phytanoyl-CoA dioxygenase family protein [Sphingobium sp.]|uniref:phytanoyl-CoA dioxygenase family protein n=1 Tax=Sphingobium sp. TaxID=1912891 RepID=UPI0028BD38C1|nr:phytanoyl-CoA dioxygenase family protein [Sphingobium sp.]
MASILDPREFKDLNESTHLVGDLEGLQEAWDRDGYWFFRDVLDQEAVAKFRDAYAAELLRQQVVEEGDLLFRYNGQPFDAAAFRENVRRTDAWRTFVDTPSIHAFFRSLLGDEPHWIANIVNRGTPPNGKAGEERTLFIHQDGAFNRGIPFFVTWVPLVTVTADMGGVAVAEGLHKGAILHPVVDDLYSGIELDSIPGSQWRHSEYRPGDLLMMDVMTPHTGLTNISDRFRFSVDLRVMRDSDDKPAIGTLVALRDDGLTVRTEEGERSFSLDSDTYFRGMDGKRLPLADVPDRFAIGSMVLVAHNAGRAMMVRPPH